MNAQWVERAMAKTLYRRVILDLDSSKSPVHGQQEGAAYNGHFECVCYHPLFLFNQFGDWEAATLRPGNVHSADGWQELLEPVAKGYRRVVAKVEWHQGELFPRIGFIVTNLSYPTIGIVRFYNGRGTAEQWIKEGKYALNWTRLSCHKFVANQVRMGLFIMAYNLGNFLRRLVLPEAMQHWSLTSLQTRMIKTGGRLVSREMLGGILERIGRLRLTPG